MASIKQNPASPPLPDFRNFGVMLRILLGVNLLALMAALVMAGEVAEWVPRFVELAAWVQPLLLFNLALLASVSPLLRRLPAVGGRVLVLFLAALSAALFVDFWQFMGMDEGGWQRVLRAALLAAFLQQYYHRATFLPHEILLPCAVEETPLIEAWLAARKQAKVHLVVPQRGTKHDLVLMAASNAEKFLADEETRRAQTDAQTLGAVEELGRYLGLEKPPYRMECFDISHIQGAETVASMVVFEGGMPKKSDYRRFKIKSTEGKPDDFLSMREVTQRRYGDLPEEDLPDLIVIDGGKGQLSSALEIIRGAGHADVPVVGLAKQFELVFKEGESEPVVLPRHSQALYLIERIRDEAHRFAITYHRKLRGKRNLVSILDHIVGIGPARRKALWSAFGSIAKIKAADVEKLAAVPGMNRPAAEAVYHFFAVQREWKGETSHELR